MKYSEDSLKNRVISNFLGSTNQEQFDNSKTYAKLAGLENDPLVIDWARFKEAISNFNSPF